jgi:hypothetical protein
MAQPNMREAFHTVLSQLCLQLRGRVGVIQDDGIFMITHPKKSPDVLFEELQTRYRSYGFSEALGSITFVSTTFAKAHLSREVGFWIHTARQQFKRHLA